MSLFGRAREPVLNRCSFCHKTEDLVTLIASPSDCERAHICDECVAVCSSIIEERNGTAPLPGAQLLFYDAVTTALARWIRKDAAGEDAAAELAEIRRLGRVGLIPPELE